MDFQNINNFSDLLKAKYGEIGTEARTEFEHKANAYYLCEMLKEKRKAAKITQSELAAKTSLQKEFISRVENGKVDVQVSTLLKILAGLGLELQIQPKLG
jgi:DNA-binding XRE family transcriptional regulator